MGKICVKYNIKKENTQNRMEIWKIIVITIVVKCNNLNQNFNSSILLMES